ncbi:hypothetical protein F5Y16DRAFT_34350 [Xylariaceae sp. FL0255]|nr:hypothetical protein F5Y16DRAFT_34350 [Xylariaceae sp. FL0255]
MASSQDLCAIPAQAPPPGQTYNLIDPVDQSRATLALGPILTVLSLTFLAGRFFLNFKKLRTADYLAIFGFVLSTSYTGVVIALRKYSRHAWDIPACWYLVPTPWKLLFASNILLGPTQFVVKVAILSLYFQLFAVNRATRWGIIGAIVFAGLIYLPHPILVIVFTAPRPGQSWLAPSMDGMASKLDVYAPIHGLGSIILDIWILVLPLPALSKLNISTKKKLKLFAVFITGSLGVASSIVSAFWRFHLLLDKPGDSSWDEGMLFLWIMTEHNVALIVGSMPAFAGFITLHIAGSFKSLRSKLLGQDSSSGDPSKSWTPLEGAESNEHRKPRANAYYYNIDDTTWNTQTTIVNAPQSRPALQEGSPGILKTTDFSNEASDANSLHAK